jgi:MtfA peptidase
MRLHSAGQPSAASNYNMAYLIPCALFIFLAWLILRKKGNRVSKTVEPIPAAYQKILEEEVRFYQRLEPAQRTVFEEKIMQFLARVRITGVKTTVEDADKVFIAASAVIPIFAFPNWEYTNLNEVLLYPDSFNDQFEIEGNTERPILGMVGTGPLQKVMLLSRGALRLGFENKTDKYNTAIHEFIHLVDKTDGETDGIPESIMSRQYVLPWINRMHQEIKLIAEQRSDINPYGATNQAEFFAVAGEYFFERPGLLEDKHPELYALLQKIFMPAAK